MRHLVTHAVVGILLAWLVAAGVSWGAAGVSSRENARRSATRKLFHEMGAIKKWRKRSWDKAYTYNSKYYQVKSNTTHKTAQYIGKMMDFTAREYRMVFGARYAQIPRLPIYAYSSMKEYNVVADAIGLPKGTGGFFSPTGDGAIHLPYVSLNGSHPITTLYHEGTHQFVHQVINFRLPRALRNKLPNVNILPSVPIWLNEGLATYMESARFNGVGLEIGRVNSSRLRSLQQRIRNQTNPPLKEVLARRYGQPFGIEHYDMAWGVVYALRHDYRTANRDLNRRKFIKFIERCKRGFMNNPARDFPKLFMKAGKLRRNFSILWHQHLATQSLREFEKIIVGNRSTIEKWAVTWEARIKRMDARKPYGGTYRGGGQGNTGLH